MPTFTPPIRFAVPPVLPDTEGLQRRLFQRMHPVDRATNVWKMPDGSYTETQPAFLSDPNPGSSEIDLTQVPLITYISSHSYEVSAAEAADLTAAGYGPYLT